MAGQRAGTLAEPTTRQELGLGSNSDGTSLILMEILRPPDSLETSATTSVDNSTFRNAFIGADLDKWESSALRRLSELTQAR
eukprot:6476148-Pyramimonas_sp.AAC.1